ncbi:hypothetical protein CRUP_006875 [Coryphaenoides rupestris]|nr:hypothetical protein CRUP_006875 [Coryphaenoides rupestris]
MEKSDDDNDEGRGLNRPQTPCVSHNTAPQWPGERTAAQHRPQWSEERTAAQHRPQWSEERTAAQHRPPVARGGVTRRVILHMDLDCFYAQVEMLRDPSLRSLPLGVQQKTIVVTCNYVAREHGVAKLMSVVDAKEKCPQLVLVRGEDLTHYRDMSYKVTELLMSFCPLVERLGLDENFVDVTEMVDKRLTRCSAFEGHVYNRSRVGHQTSKRLQALGLVSVQDLQLFPLVDLVKEFGASTGQRLKNLSLGIDESPVTPSGPPQSLSDEDSFKKISTPGEVVEKSRDLLSSLVERMQKDGRRPQTLRLTIRRFSADNKWMSRESRQGPIPPHVGHKVTSGGLPAISYWLPATG